MPGTIASSANMRVSPSPDATCIWPHDSLPEKYSDGSAEY